MALRAKTAIDRLHNVQLVHVVFSILVLIFGVLDVMSARQKAKLLEGEGRQLLVVGVWAQQAIASLREHLVEHYGLSGGAHTATEAGRLSALMNDLYLARRTLRDVQARVSATSPNVLPIDADPNSARIQLNRLLYGLQEHLHFGVTSTNPVGDLPMAETELGTMAVANVITELALEDLARLAYAASASPRLIVSRLEPLGKAVGPLTSIEVTQLRSAATAFEKKRPSDDLMLTRARSLWREWLGYVNGVSGARSEEETAKRRQQAATASYQTLSAVVRDLNDQTTLLEGKGKRNVKVPGIDTDFPLHQVLLFFPWIIVALMAVRFTLLHEIHGVLTRAVTLPRDKLQDVLSDLIGSLGFASRAGVVAVTISGGLFWAAELISVLAIPIVGIFSPTIAVHTGGQEKVVYWLGCSLSLAIWFVYLAEMRAARAQFKDLISNG
jgi:hypothetical protein